MKSECKLCCRSKELRKSHLIPQFITEWIKKTSATGYLRLAINPNKRIQDGVKKFFLCSDCENILSKYENYFAKNIFYPYWDSKKRSFKYNSNLKKFIISLSWRILADNIDKFEKDNSHLSKYVRDAESTWRKYLLEERTVIGNYKNHLFFFDYIERTNDSLPPKFQFYTLRGIDGTIYYSSSLVHIYSKIPGFIFFSTIHPTNPEGWKGTEVLESGEISFPQEISYPGFGDFLKDRARLVYEHPISDKQQTKINKTILKNKDKFLNSKSCDVWITEKLRRTI